MRKVGLAAFEDKKSQKEQYKSVGNTLLTVELAEVKNQISSLQELLRKYGREHLAEIQQSPELRNEFSRLCARFGIDCLSYTGSTGTSHSRRGDKYYDALAIRIIEICRATHEENGGVVDVRRVTAALAQDKFPVHSSESDICKAVKKLKVFGPGLEVDQLPNGTKFIRSVPRELNTDQSDVFMACEALGYVTQRMLCDNLGWSRSRTETVLNDMAYAGLLWVDLQAEPTEYWSPAAMGS